MHKRTLTLSRTHIHTHSYPRTRPRIHTQPEAAKRVYFRAISSCASSKSMWLHALRLPAVRALMSQQELFDVVVRPWHAFARLCLCLSRLWEH